MCLYAQLQLCMYFRQDFEALSLMFSHVFSALGIGRRAPRILVKSSFTELYS